MATSDGSGASATAHTTFVVSGMTGSVNGVSITFNSWSLSGDQSPADFYFELVSPNGTRFDFFGNFNGGCAVMPSTTNITFADNGSQLVQGCGNGQATVTLTSGTYLPDVDNAPNGSAYGVSECPSPDGNSTAPTCAPNQGAADGSSTDTFASAFSGATANGTWTVYSESDFSGTTGSISSLTLQLTTFSATNTTTSVGASAYQAFTSGTNDNLTFTATVTATGKTVNEGAVTFYDNGNAISGCSGKAVSGNQTTCNELFSGAPEGVHNITAAYTDTASNPQFGDSNNDANPVQVFIDNVTASSNVSSTGGTFCDNGTVTLTSDNGGNVTAQPYPQHVYVSGLSGSLATLTLELPGITTGQGDSYLNAFDMLLEGPDGKTFVPIAEAGTTSGVSGLTLYLADSGSSTLNTSSNPSSNTSSTPYKPADFDSNLTSGVFTFPNAGSTTILDSPPARPYNYPANQGTDSMNATFSSDLNGTWSLYVASRDHAFSGTTGGYCLIFTTSTEAPTSTSVSANPNPATVATGQSSTAVTLSAHVSSGGNPVNTGTVTFYSNGTQVGTASNWDGNGNVQLSPSPSFAEGTYTIGADYSGVPSQYSASESNTITLQVDNQTLETDNSDTSYGYCNPGPINIAASTVPQQYPSRVLITNAPGTLQTVGLALNAVTYPTPSDLEMLLEGPGGATNNIVFWGNIAYVDNGGNFSSAGPLNNQNFIIEDGQTALPEFSSGSFSGGTYSPGAYFVAGESNINFPSPAPPSNDWNFAQSLGTTTFGSQFAQNSNPNGIYSFFVYHNINGSTGTIGSHCVNITVKPPVAQVGVSPLAATFTQGDGSDTYTITVKNNGPGSTGTQNALTVADTLPSGLHVVSIAETANSNGGQLQDWTCNTSTVTCTRSTPMPASETDTITLTVSVDYSNHGSGLTNSVALSGGGVDTTNSTLSASDSTTINPGPVQVTFDTNPTGLSYTVGSNSYTGQQTITITNYQTVSVNTTSPQTPSSGTQDTFSSWSGGNNPSSASETINISSTTGTASYTANFIQTVAVKINTSPQGLLVSVDGGTAQAAPVTPPAWVVGSQHTIATSSTQSGGTGTQYVFQSWSDGTTNPASDTVTASSGTTSYTANFQTQYLLTTSVTPSGGGTVSATAGGNPSAANGYYASGTVVSLQAKPNSAYAFHSWTGTTSSSTNPLVVTMNSPVTETANFQTAYQQLSGLASIHYIVTVNTSSELAQNGYVDLQFNPSSQSTQAANVAVANFFTDGLLNPPPASPSGEVSGVLPGTVQLANGQSLNEYTESMTFGTTITFELYLYGPAITNPNGQGGGTFTLDFPNGQGGYLFTAGPMPVFTVTINGDGTTTAQAYPSQNNGPPVVIFVAPLQLPPAPVTETGLLYSPLLENPGSPGSPGGGTTNFTITNTSGAAITGPIQLVLTNLPAGVTGANNTGTFNGSPYWTVTNSSALALGAALTVTVQLNYPSSTAVSTTPAVYTGSLQ
ncbi:MAG: Ig-like domain repeat protein [Acidobacteriaceae bacterium]|nr:Ig-like domain repeat protein [Acidobacteriaceae bacterium]